MQFLPVTGMDGMHYAVNPAQITYIEDTDGTCTVYFSENDVLHVQEGMASLLQRLQAT